MFVRPRVRGNATADLVSRNSSKILLILLLESEPKEDIGIIVDHGFVVPGPLPMNDPWSQCASLVFNLVAYYPEASLLKKGRIEESSVDPARLMQCLTSAFKTSTMVQGTETSGNGRPSNVRESVQGFMRKKGGVE